MMLGLSTCFPTYSTTLWCSALLTRSSRHFSRTLPCTNNHNHGKEDSFSSRKLLRQPVRHETVDPWLRQEISRFKPTLPIEQSFAPPSSWYSSPSFFELEQESIFLNQWVAVDVVISEEPGAYQTGTFAKQPYLLTRNATGELQGFFNVCTHAGSCLVGPWTSACPSKPVALHASLVGESTNGNLHHQRKLGLACPYHGWEFSLDGQLIKATHMRGIKNFSPKAYGLKPIPVEQVGPIVFMNFAASQVAIDEQTEAAFVSNRQLLSDRLEQSGFPGDFGDLELVKTRQYTVQCNWKVFCDNYGDGCYHCGYAHTGLAESIDESGYSTQILSPEVTVQNAPPAVNKASSRFGTERAAVYAQWYPNIMFNRYGPWLDVDIVKPLTESTCVVHKAWFLEHDFVVPKRNKSNTNEKTTKEEFIEASLSSSTQIHDEDVFLCENAQRGINSRGFQQSRYVPSKQIASHHFHRRLVRDLKM